MPPHRAPCPDHSQHPNTVAPRAEGQNEPRMRSRGKLRKTPDIQRALSRPPHRGVRERTPPVRPELVDPPNPHTTSHTWTSQNRQTTHGAIHETRGGPHVPSDRLRPANDGLFPPQDPYRRFCPRHGRYQNINARSERLDPRRRLPPPFIRITNDDQRGVTGDYRLQEPSRARSGGDPSSPPRGHSERSFLPSERAQYDPSSRRLPGAGAAPPRHGHGYGHSDRSSSHR